MYIGSQYPYYVWMSIADRFIILDEHSEALVLQLVEFKYSFSSPALAPPIVRKLREANAWPLYNVDTFTEDVLKVHSSIFSHVLTAYAIVATFSRFASVKNFCRA
jgi:hypothetical protein